MEHFGRCRDIILVRVVSCFNVMNSKALSTCSAVKKLSTVVVSKTTSCTMGKMLFCSIEHS
uniref:Uncharacterized protein n=1 Tax=Magallana gigas TaxID=29159 RepID=K1PUQ3_MAGGI